MMLVVVICVSLNHQPYKGFGLIGCSQTVLDNVYHVPVLFFSPYKMQMGIHCGKRCTISTGDLLCNDNNRHELFSEYIMINEAKLSQNTFTVKFVSCIGGLYRKDLLRVA